MDVLLLGNSYSYAGKQVREQEKNIATARSAEQAPRRLCPLGVPRSAPPLSLPSEDASLEDTAHCAKQRADFRF